MEVSSHALAQSRIAGIEFDAACITNVRRDHLDFHNTLANYREAKARLLKQLTPDGFAVLNADDPVGQQLRIISRWRDADDRAWRIKREVTATIVEQHTKRANVLAASRQRHGAGSHEDDRRSDTSTTA